MNNGNVAQHGAWQQANLGIRQAAQTIAQRQLEKRHILATETAAGQLFALGAVKAALWGFDQKPGLYSMADVLGLNA